MAQDDKAFTGSIPALYDRYLGPMIFEPYADDLAARAKALAPSDVLETAAGTGIVTKKLAEVLPEATRITATDLNQAMIDTAIAKFTSPRVEWQVCDAAHLPFDDASFDCVLCQFGIMFFPSKVQALQEARRVLRPGGTILFNVWDRIEVNPIFMTIADTIAARYPDDPPNFPRRTPYGHHDIQIMCGYLQEAGFEGIDADVLSLPCHCPSPDEAAMAVCHGSPLRSEIEARDPSGLDAATRAAGIAVAERFGNGPITSSMQAIIFTASK